MAKEHFYTSDHTGPRGRLQGYHEEVVLSIENKRDIFGDKAKWDTSRALNCPCYKLRHIM